MQTDILAFLTSIQDSINSVDELLTALREENKRVEIYGLENMNELLELSAYQFQLEQVEMKLKAPSLIRVSFSEGWTLPVAKTEEEKIESLILKMIMRFIRETKF